MTIKTKNHRKVGTTEYEVTVYGADQADWDPDDILALLVVPTLTEAQQFPPTVKGATCAKVERRTWIEDEYTDFDTGELVLDGAVEYDDRFHEDWSPEAGWSTDTQEGATK